MQTSTTLHHLAAAGAFVDREAELAILRRFWELRSPSVLTIVGMGGSGKTALTAQFVEELQQAKHPPAAVLMWNFQDEPDVDEFVHAAELAVGVPRGVHANAEACRRDLFARLAAQGHSLIVLDGAENASRVELKALLADVVATPGAQAIVTARQEIGLPKTQMLALGTLPHTAAMDLLDRAGIPRSLQAAAVQYGGYPLSLALFIGHVLGGGSVPESPALPFLQHPARPLTFLLQQLDKQLPAEQRELMRRMALVHNGARLADLAATYSPGTTFDIEAAAKELVAKQLVTRSKDGIVRVHPVIRDYALKTWGRQIEPSFVLDLLGRGEPRLPAEKAELIAEMLGNIRDSRALDRDEIAALAAQLSPDAPHSARAYSALLESALRLTPGGNSKRRAFLSYVREDAETVARLRRDLETQGIDVWQDIDRIGAGKRWKDEIRQAIEEGDAFIACFSPSFAKRSRTHMNEELLIAVDELRKRPRTTAWFVSILLGACDIPELPIGAGETLRDLQWVDLHLDWPEGVRRIAHAILEP